MTEIRLAHGGGHARSGKTLADPVFRDNPPALLIAYPYFKSEWLPVKDTANIRDLMLDSGAYSVWKSGKTISLKDYCAFCLELMKTEPRLVEIIGLDEIGSSEGSVRNAHLMWDKFHIPAMPVFHIGDPWEHLDEYCSKWSKVGLSCRFGETPAESEKFYEQCFARAWPHKFHSFGWTKKSVLMTYPFHSADATTWIMAPTKFGNWQRFGYLSWRGNNQTVVVNVQTHMELEAMLRGRWGRELKKLEKLEEKFEVKVQFRRVVGD